MRRNAMLLVVKSIDIRLAPARAYMHRRWTTRLTPMAQPVRMEMRKSPGGLKRYLPSKRWFYSRIYALGKPRKVRTQSREHETEMSAVWSIDPEPPVDNGEQTGHDDIGVARHYRTSLVRGRLSGDDHLQGDPPVR